MTASILLYQSDYLSITREPGKSWLHVKWNGELSDALVIEGCEKLLEILVEQEVSQILNDTTDAEGSWTQAIQAMKYLVFNWLPRMQAAGLKACAHVFGPSAGVRMSAGASLLLFDPLEAGFKPFCNCKVASAWLDSNSAISA